MTECVSQLPYDFEFQRPLVVKFSQLDLSADAGILLARQANEKLQVCRGGLTVLRSGETPAKLSTACIR